MFGILNLDNKTYLIVKKETISEDEGLPKEHPFEVYGFVSVEKMNDRLVVYKLITNLLDVKSEEQNIIQQVLDSKRYNSLF